MKALVLPSITLGFVSAGIVSRLTRSSLIETLNEDYVRTARAKGLPERLTVSRHALKNAFIPVITMLGIQFGGMLAGGGGHRDRLQPTGAGATGSQCDSVEGLSAGAGHRTLSGRHLRDGQSAGRCVVCVAGSANPL